MRHDADSAGLKPDTKTARGTTALMLAILNVHYDLASMLLRKGADPNIADKDGVSPLQHAQDRRYDAIAAMIRDAGGR